MFNILLPVNQYTRLNLHREKSVQMCAVILAYPRTWLENAAPFSTGSYFNLTIIVTRCNFTLAHSESVLHRVEC